MTSDSNKQSNVNHITWAVGYHCLEMFKMPPVLKCRFLAYVVKWVFDFVHILLLQSRQNLRTFLENKVFQKWKCTVNILVVKHTTFICGLWTLKFGSLLGLCSKRIWIKSKIHFTVSYSKAKISIFSNEAMQFVYSKDQVM